jgi:hypothetical protein
LVAKIAHRGSGRGSKKKAEEKSLESYRRLTEFFTPGKDTQLPPILEFNNDPEFVMRMITILEITHWRWTINEILQQPDSLIDDVIAAKVYGEEIRRQTEK